jgi:CRP-like cAMP-binding protein
VHAGEALFEVGDPGDSLFVVQAGEVALLEPGLDGAGRLVAQLGPGDPVGEAEVLLGRPHALRAVAVSDARLLVLDRAMFRQMCLERPEIGLRMAEGMARRAADLERRLAVLGMSDLVRPIARCLLQRAKPDSRLAITLRGLAQAAGLSMREAHRGLRDLLERKHVRLVDDVLVLEDPSALEACLAEDGATTGSSAR